MTTGERDHLMWLTPPRQGGDVSLALRALAGVERLFPGVRFDQTGSPHSGPPLGCEAATWLARQLRSQEARAGFFSLMSREAGGLVLRFADELGLEDGAGHHPRAAFLVWLSAEAGTFAGREHEVMRVLGDEIGAWQGTYDPGRAIDGLHGIQMEFRELSGITMTEAIGVELPVLYGYLDFHKPMRPCNLGWLNYWSAEVSAWLGFPDPAVDGPWLPLAVPSPTTGAWVVSVTPERFDERRPEHLRALSRAWARFNRVGLREPPPWPVRET